MNFTEAKNMFRLTSLFLSLFLGVISFSYAEDEFSKIEIKTTKVSDGIYMLEGSGGNIGIASGEDGIFMIDDQIALSPRKFWRLSTKFRPNPSNS